MFTRKLFCVTATVPVVMLLTASDVRAGEILGFDSFRDAKSFVVAAKTARKLQVHVLYLQRQAIEEKAREGSYLHLLRKMQQKSTELEAPSIPHGHSQKALDLIIAANSAYRGIEQTNRSIQDLNHPLNPYTFMLSSSRGWLFTSNRGNIKVRQVVDESNALVTIDSDELWLTDANTSGWTDDSSVGFQALLVKDGTKTYTTSLGSQRTIPLVRCYDLKPYEDELTRREEVRDWRIDGRRYSGIFWFYDAARNKVSMMSLDGTAKNITFSSLSIADQDFVLHAVGVHGPPGFRQWTSADGKHRREAKIVHATNNEVILENRCLGSEFKWNRRG